eukprot:14249-Heterococcus_DN1.PRE.7
MDKLYYRQPASSTIAVMRCYSATRQTPHQVSNQSALMLRPLLAVESPVRQLKYRCKLPVYAACTVTHRVFQ